METRRSQLISVNVISFGNICYRSSGTFSISFHPFTFLNISDSFPYTLIELTFKKSYF